ncbi:hypothetical protein ACOMHN_029358 [Nucella lapillus]
MAVNHYHRDHCLTLSTDRGYVSGSSVHYQEPWGRTLDDPEILSKLSTLRSPNRHLVRIPDFHTTTTTNPTTTPTTPDTIDTPLDSTPSLPSPAPSAPPPPPPSESPPLPSPPPTPSLSPTQESEPPLQVLASFSSSSSYPAPDCHA